MDAAAKLALVKQLRPYNDTTVDTDAIYAAYILMAQHAVLNRLYPFANVDIDRIVEETNMIVGAYTLAAQPPYPVNLNVTVDTDEDTADTMGTIVVTGIGFDGTAATDTITPIANTTVEGTTVFKRIYTVTGAGWVKDAVEGTNDTITVGIGETKAVPSKLEYKQCEIAAFLLNKRGAEGQTSHSENGVSRSYEGATIPPSMLADITPFVGVFT
jgi:hypothetical protein